MQYVNEQIRIAAPAARIWAMVAGFGALEAWCPAIKSMELEGHGIGSVRTAHLDGGVVAREQLLEVDADRFKIVYSLLEPSALPLQNIRSTLQLFPRASESTDVVWYSEADAASEDIIASMGALIGGFYRENLNELKMLTEKERVVRKLV